MEPNEKNPNQTETKTSEPRTIADATNEDIQRLKNIVLGENAKLQDLENIGKELTEMLDNLQLNEDNQIEKEEFEKLSNKAELFESKYNQYMQETINKKMELEETLESYGLIFPNGEEPLWKNKSNIPVLNAIRPNKYIVPNNSFIQKLTSKDVVYNQTDGFIVNNKKQIKNLYFLKFNGENIYIDNDKYKINEYDRAVYNAVTSLYIVGNIMITIDMIYKTMIGKKGEESAKIQKHYNSISESMEKLRYTNVKIHLKNEISERKLTIYNENMEDGIIDSMLLCWKSITLKSKNHTVTGYKINDIPILYEYASIISKQVLTIDINVLNTPINNTSNVIILKNYLIRRIEVIKNKKNKQSQNTILLSTIYELLNIYEGDKTTKQIEKATSKIRKDIGDILGYWKGINYIKNYKVEKNGRSFYSVKIDT